YRWNTILADLGFLFKEEIIWNKRYANSPLMPIFRTHETISIFTKKKGKINNTLIPYMEKKQFDLYSLVNDVKRIKSGLKNEKSYDEIIHFLETEEKIYRRATEGSRLTRSKKSALRADQSVDTLSSIKNGTKPSSIITIKRPHYNRIHPTQKPIRLFEILLSLVTKEGDIVCDPFMGSQSSRLAAYNNNLNFYGWEIDEEYYKLGCDRFKEYTKQTKLF